MQDSNPWPDFLTVGTFFLPPFLYLTVHEGSLGVALLSFVVLRIAAILSAAIEEAEGKDRQARSKPPRGDDARPAKPGSERRD